MKPIFIAEIKTQSPFGYRSPYSFATLMETAIEHGDWISVHTNALWGGDFDAISFVRKHTKKPILAKGIHGTDFAVDKALAHGADYVLVVDRATAPTLRKFCLFEWKSFADFKEYATINRMLDRRHVCNSRDLRTGQRKLNCEMDDFAESCSWWCQASGIRKPADVHPKANAFIVGEHLMDFVKVQK
jgi:indole-3-glycerol phosphate synthase